MIIRQQAEEHTTEDDEEDVDLLVDQLKNEEDGIKIGETKMEERTPLTSPTTKKDKPRTKSTQPQKLRKIADGLLEFERYADRKKRL
jgi:chromatin segregation and condensation protein Rec8/ScpA/Scc1 (kleisin family)